MFEQYFYFCFGERLQIAAKSPRLDPHPVSGTSAVNPSLKAWGGLADSIGSSRAEKGYKNL